jgi:hypothetical protein
MPEIREQWPRKYWAINHLKGNLRIRWKGCFASQFGNRSDVRERKVKVIFSFHRRMDAAFCGPAVRIRESLPPQPNSRGS